jgi:hypothetical protein
MLMHHLSSILLELPVSIVKRAHLSGLQPAGNAVEMEGMLRHSLATWTLENVTLTHIANSPSNSAFFVRSSTLICLTLNA